MNDLIQRGIGASRAGRPEEAVRWFGAAAQGQPANLQLRVWLGQALCAADEVISGVAQLRGAGLALAGGPGAAERAQALQVALELQKNHAMDAALELLAALLAREPGNAHAMYLRATALAQLNRPDEALTAAREAARLSPENHGAKILLASLAVDAKLYDEAEEKLRALLAGALAPRDAHRVRKELARLLDRRGDADGAFVELAAAEALVAEIPELAAIDRAVVPGLIARARADFDEALTRKWQGHDFGDRPPPLFVMGFYRSGTTMTQQVLAAHPQTFVSDEAPLVKAMQRQLDIADPSSAGATEKLRKLDAAGIAQLRARYWAAARGRHGVGADAPLFVDKYTLRTVDLGFLSTVFPDARILFLVRDPRDTCLSAYSQLMPPSQATAHLLSWQGTARLYADVMQFWLEMRGKIATPWLELRYEDVVADFERSYRRVMDFAGLEWDPAIAGFHEGARGRFISTPSRGQVAQPLYASAVGRWHPYERHFAPVMPTLQPFVDTFGY